MNEGGYVDVNDDLVPTPADPLDSGQRMVGHCDEGLGVRRPVILLRLRGAALALAHSVATGLERAEEERPVLRRKLTP